MKEKRKRRKMLVTVPASSPNFEYAVRQLFGGDHELNATVSAVVEVDLTEDQERFLDGMTPDLLKALRNGPNAVAINRVEVLSGLGFSER